MEEEDLRHMKRCLELARRSEGKTSPNPMVGALVLDREGNPVGSGHHQAAGQAHAEINALDEAGERARGGTIYVSLEPCCHFGRTPPCVDRLIESGIKRVVAAVRDPNPQVAGKGFARLREHGLEVVENVMADEARWLNRGFFKATLRGMPWVCLKLATTLDGRIADRMRQSKWITGPEARRLVHDLRGRLDCVMIGAGTAREDDPSLNVRDVQGKRDPLRVLIDTDLTVSRQSRLFDPETGGATIVYCSEEALRRRGEGYGKHVSLVPVDCLPVDCLPGDDETEERQVVDLKKCLEHLAGSTGVRTVLCEGGGRLAGTLSREGLIDEIYWFYAARILGDRLAIPAVDHGHAIMLGEARQWEIMKVEQMGADALIHCASMSAVQEE